MHHNILLCPCQAAIIKESGPKAPDPTTGANNSQTHSDTLAASSRQDLLFSFVYVLCVRIEQRARGSSSTIQMLEHKGVKIISLRFP